MRVCLVSSNPFVGHFGYQGEVEKRWHCFLTDDRDLRSMETSLLGLLEDFQSGKLKAFAGDRAMEKMRRVREQQEMLAKLHFQLYEEESKLGTMTEDSSILTERNLKLLGKGLQDLSDSVQNLGWEDGINLNRKI